MAADTDTRPTRTGPAPGPPVEPVDPPPEPTPGEPEPMPDGYEPV